MDGAVKGWRGALRDINRSLVSLRMTLPYIFGLTSRHRAITEEYPDRISARMPEDLPIKFRGFLRNDVKKCNGCGYCVKVCPVNCIRLETEEKPDHKKHIAVFEVDISKCMFCGLCVEVCTPCSLKHTTNYEGSSEAISDLLFSFGEGWATPTLKARWEEEKQKKEAKSVWEDEL